MNYHFHTMNFSKDRKIINIHFDDDKYQGLERFLNDDGILLRKDVKELLSQSPCEEVSLGGNRTVIFIYPHHVEICDQWDEGTHGYFPPTEMPKEFFEKVFLDWEENVFRQSSNYKEDNIEELK